MSLAAGLARRGKFGYHWHMQDSGDIQESAPLHMSGSTPDVTGALPVLQPAAARKDQVVTADDLAVRARELEKREQALVALEAECRARVHSAEDALEEMRRQLSSLTTRPDAVSSPPAVPDNLVPFAPRRAPELPVDELVSSLSRAAEDAHPLPPDSPGPADRMRELEHDLRAAEDQIHALEAELRKARGQQEPRVAPEVARSEFDPTATEHISEEVLAEGPARFLALIDGDTEILHRLMRRVTIGRAADNDIQVDARFVSRYHAAVMAGPNQTIIEDLGSTNGLIINGKRVARHQLRDGDVVRIGKSRFRFMTRPR